MTQLDLTEKMLRKNTKKLSNKRFNQIWCKPKQSVQNLVKSVKNCTM